MHIDVKTISIAALAAALVSAGAVATTASAAPTFEPRPLVEEVSDHEQAQGFIVSQDGKTLIIPNSWSEGSFVDIETREIVGKFPAISVSGVATPSAPQATGPVHALSTQFGYALLDLNTGAWEAFELLPRPGETYAPGLSVVRQNPSGSVTGVTHKGDFVILKEGEIISSKP